ncbi:MAG: hypothetical protein WC376_00960 [Candidatus Nanoarchaeia archaeon]
MAESVIGTIFSAMFSEFAKVIVWVLLIAVFAILLIIILLFIFSGANIIVLIKKNKTKGIIFLILFIASIIWAFNKQFIPIVLLSVYFIISLLISLVKKIIKKK